MQRTVPDWGAAPERPRGTAHIAQRAGVLVVFIALAFGLAYLLGPTIGFAPILIINAAVGFIAFWWVNTQGVLALRNAGAHRCRAKDEPRFANVAAGLAADLAMRKPALYVIDQGGPNSLACIARGPAIAVTRSLLDDYTRTELEAVVAHGLVRLRSGAIERAALAIALGPLGTKSLPPVGGADDVHACALTRFPLALASAIEKAEPRSGRFAPFWFVANGGGHRDAADRIVAIRDL